MESQRKSVSSNEGRTKNSEIKNHPKVVLGNDFGNKGAACLQTLDTY